MLKCLSLMQPWATLLAHGLKTYETRSWSTRHRGPLLIHASRRFPEAARDLCTQSPYIDALRAAGYTSPLDLPRGAIIGVVTIAEVLPIPLPPGRLTDIERAFGDYSPNRYAWRCTSPCTCLPIKTGGRLGIFDCPASVVAQVLEVFPELREAVEPQEKPTV